MRKQWVLFIILSLLPVTVASAADQQGRRYRNQLAAPGPQEDMSLVCDRILSQDTFGGSSDGEDYDRADDAGPDDVYDGI